LELFPFFHQIFKILILFVLYFKNYKRQVVSWNWKHVQHVKIYLPCNFEVNPIIHLDRFREDFFCHRTKFWKEAIQGSFHKSLRTIGPVVSEEKIFFKFHPLFFQIEISSNGQNGSILSQKVPKFEMYKHNELFNIYYGIFYELWTFLSSHFHLFNGFYKVFAYEVIINFFDYFFNFIL
jgi:hypothetical protein